MPPPRSEPGSCAPRSIYWRRGKNPCNCVPRTEDGGRLSFWQSFDAVFDGAAVFKPGDEYIIVDANLLPAGAVMFDSDPPGHVSLIGVQADVLRA